MINISKKKKINYPTFNPNPTLGLGLGLNYELAWG